MNSDQWFGHRHPVLAGILFIVAINTSGGYLLQAVVEEKENRTMEILVTSVSPDQLMAGKIAGKPECWPDPAFVLDLNGCINDFAGGKFIPVNPNPQITGSFLVGAADRFSQLSVL